MRISLLSIALFSFLFSQEKPSLRDRPSWIYLLPDVGVSIDGTPHVTWSASKIMSYIRAEDRSDYEVLLSAWQDSVTARHNQIDSALLLLDLEKAINDSIYYDALLSLALIRYERGDIDDEKLLNVRKSFYDSKYNLRRLRLQIFKEGVDQ